MSYSDDLRWGNAHAHFFRHLGIMPGWHKGVLFLALVLGIVGGTGWYMNRAAAQPPVSGMPDATRDRGSGRVIENRPASSANSPAATSTWNDWLAKLSTPSMKIGISVIAGFVFGWIFRGFLKTMAFLALLVFGALAALSYFGVLNIDMTLAKEKYATGMQWATDQFWKLKDVVTAHLPSSSGGAVGALLGFKRR